jgi:vitellogenic carboxypeptidase-like protein
VGTDAIREQIHVGAIPYASFNETVEVELKGDWMRGVVDMLVPLLEAPDFKVLVYSGQNDIILGPPLTEQFLDALEWDGKDLYAAADREVWKVEGGSQQDQLDEIAGYVKKVEKCVPPLPLPLLPPSLPHPSFAKVQLPVLHRARRGTYGAPRPARARPRHDHRLRRWPVGGDFWEGFVSESRVYSKITQFGAPVKIKRTRCLSPPLDADPRPW